VYKAWEQEIPSAVPAQLGLKAPALAWPEGALAFQNPRPSHGSWLQLGHGLAWPRPGLLQQIPWCLPTTATSREQHTCQLTWACVLVRCCVVGSSSSDCVCVQVPRVEGTSLSSSANTVSNVYVHHAWSVCCSLSLFWVLMSGWLSKGKLTNVMAGICIHECSDTYESAILLYWECRVI